MNHQSLEDLVQKAKSVAVGGAGFAVGDEYAVLFYDFAKSAAAGAVGPHRTGLYIAPNTIVAPDYSRVDTTVVGAFNLQLIAAGDLLAATTNPAAGALLTTLQVVNTLTEKEVVLNVTGVATAGKALFVFRLRPF